MAADRRAGKILHVGKQPRARTRTAVGARSAPTPSRSARSRDGGALRPPSERGGQFWWRAVGDNNKLMAASELMISKQSCLDAIATVKNEALVAHLDDMTTQPATRGAV
ncbi:MAG: YegP family protein [Chloroflexota bacterium]